MSLVLDEGTPELYRINWMCLQVETMSGQLQEIPKVVNWSMWVFDYQSSVLLVVGYFIPFRGESTIEIFCVWALFACLNQIQCWGKSAPWLEG